MGLDLDKVIVAFCADSLAQWEVAIHRQQVLFIKTPIAVFVSIELPAERLNQYNLTNLMKETCATLVFEKIIVNSQQIAELGCEKKVGPKMEIRIFLQNA